MIAYAASSESASSAHPVRLRYNDFGGADGVTQNSTRLTEFSGLSGTRAEIVDP